MKNKKTLLAMAAPLLVAAVFAFGTKAHAQTASCTSAKQTCYKVTYLGMTVRTVAGLLKVAL